MIMSSNIISSERDQSFYWVIVLSICMTINKIIYIKIKGGTF